jgi:hypothetical protein
MAVRRNQLGWSARAARITGVVLLLVVAIPTTARSGFRIREVLGFDSSVGQTFLPAKTSPNLFTPSKCRTVTYTAGPAEIAVASIAATATPSSPYDGNLRMAVTRSLPLSPFVSVNVAAQIESMADGTAMVSSRARITLEEGTTYQFGAGFAADEETQVSTFACQGTIVIYAEVP